MASIRYQHSYIVLKDQHGALAELLSDGSYQEHTHNSLRRHDPLEILIPDSDLAPLDIKQCFILDAVSIDVRYTVYSTPGLLEWGVGLKVGDTVLAQLPGKRKRGSKGGVQYTIAIIWWAGIAWDGHRFGVEITVSSLLYHHIMTSHHNHHFCIRTP